jgi:hypothetical protein
MNNMQLAGEKFALGAGETLRMHGYVLYVRGRVSVAHGDGYLTTRRFVFCRKPGMQFGLGRFFKGRQDRIRVRSRGITVDPPAETRAGPQTGLPSPQRR